MSMEETLNLLRSVRLNPARTTRDVLIFKWKEREDVEYHVNEEKWRIKGNVRYTLGTTFDFIQWYSVYTDDDKDLPKQGP